MVDSPTVIEELEKENEQVDKDSLNEEELKTLWIYIKTHKLVTTNTTLRHPRSVVQKHKDIEAKFYKGTLPTFTKPDRVFPVEEEDERLDISVESQLKEVTPSHHEEVVIPIVEEDPEESRRLTAEFFLTLDIIQVKFVRKLKVFKGDEDVSTSGYCAQSVVLKAKVDEIEATKRLTVSKERIDEVPKEVYSSSTVRDTRNISDEERAS
ncbi:hypothetical protein L1987_24340 [Smallanthus sonchifolius]|uniref:Uncharacterized protein n=1 Tax=Smallanthus sonchifolius TaxID=185202 RepID=A0ACB9ILN2_9ASTR|nr:hypothetical protein L1987_24340 [Smallanthus sonchifolius]